MVWHLRMQFLCTVFMHSFNAKFLSSAKFLCTIFYAQFLCGSALTYVTSMHAWIILLALASLVWILFWLLSMRYCIHFFVFLPTNHRLIGVQSLYPFWVLSHEKDITHFTPFKWWFVLPRAEHFPLILAGNKPFERGRVGLAFSWERNKKKCSCTPFT